MYFQESLDYFLKTQSKVKIYLELLEILVNGKGASVLDWGWFAAVGEGNRFDPAAVATTQEDDNDTGINRLDGWIWQNWDLNPSLPDSTTYPSNNIQVTYSMCSCTLISHMSLIMFLNQQTLIRSLLYFH